MTEPEKPRRGLDPELQAMAKIDRILDEFGDDATFRILTWLNGRYDLKIDIHHSPVPHTLEGK